MINKSPAPEGILLSRIRWDFFVTLTHAPSKDTGRWGNLSARVQSERFVSWHRAVLKKLNLHRNSFRWIKRWEIGRGGREHFHALVNFHKPSLANRTTGYVLKHIWEHQRTCKCKSEDIKDKTKYAYCGNGNADVRACDSGGVSEYITKLQNEYEMNRFGAERFRHVEFSKSALKCIRRNLGGVAVYTGN